MPGSGGGYNIHLMCAPEGNSEFCFPESLNVPETKSRETLRLEGKQSSLFPEGAHVRFFFSVSKVGLPLMGYTAVQYTDCYLSPCQHDF